MLIWTTGYRPFILGGNCNAPLGIEISEEELGPPIDLPFGFQAYEFENPNSGETHIIEKTSGAFIGNDLQQVCNDIEQCGDKEMMQKQVANALEQRRSVETMEPEKFWALFR